MEQPEKETRLEKKAERDILWLFDIALVIKGIDGTLEMLGGFLVLVIPPALVVRVVEFVTAGELASDPDDPIANALRELAHSFAVHTHYFISLYLILHGVIKALLVVGIFSGKKIAYPLFMAALVVFGAYEAYRGVTQHSLLLEGLAAFDALLLALTWYEYRRRYPVTPRPDTFV